MIVRGLCLALSVLCVALFMGSLLIGPAGIAPGAALAALFLGARPEQDGGS